MVFSATGECRRAPTKSRWRSSVSAAAREGQVELRFWIVSDSVVRLATLFAVPSSMGIESGGFVGFVYRRRTRVAANDLLGRFGQPPIS